jgi:hypothetical protein
MDLRLTLMITLLVTLANRDYRIWYSLTAWEVTHTIPDILVPVRWNSD